MSSEAGYSVAELLVAAMARDVEDGDLVVQGIGTHLPTCAYFLAKSTHAPSCCLLYSVGGTFSDRIGQLGVSTVEQLALTRPLRRVGYAELVCDALTVLPFKEFSRPAQVDGRGNTNNTVIGPYADPKIRLPGAGGIPDFSPYETHVSYLYVPRHDRRSLVAELDFRSGAGGLSGESEAERRRLGVTGRGARRVITDLAVIDFEPDGAVLRSLHPGVELEAVVEATAFPFDVPPDAGRTPAPTADELSTIRAIDPHAARDLELVSAAERLARVRELAAIDLAAGMEDGT